MTDSKSTCCGKPVNVFNGDEGTNNWICGACRKACDVADEFALKSPHTHRSYERVAKAIRQTPTQEGV